MDFICVFFGVLFTIAGFLFFFGKAHIHLSAWKNMPQEEKDQIKILPICRNIGEVIILSGIIFLLKGLWAGLFKPLVYGFHDCLACGCRVGCLVHDKEPALQAMIVRSVVLDCR